MEQLLYLMDTYPILKTIVTIMILCRIVFKPIMLIVAKYVELTVEKDDDSKLNKFMQSKTYKMISFILDLTLSIKLKQVK